MDLLFLPHDRVSHKIYKFQLIMVDIASQNKEVEPLVDKSSKEVALTLCGIYKHGQFRWPILLQTDPRRAFMNAVTILMAKQDGNSAWTYRGTPGPQDN